MMVESVTGGKSLPAEVLDQIIVKTDGVPLFIEELTKTILGVRSARCTKRQTCFARPIAAPCNPEHPTRFVDGPA